MKSIRLAAILFSMAGALMLGACSGEADVDVENGDTVVTTPDTQHTSTDTVKAPDTTAALGQEMSDEGVEKLVEAALIAKPGFEGVTVESKPDGVIVLVGTVPTENEKTQAKTIAAGVAGVKSVENNITVAPATP